jgi:hypothetical protein
MNTNGYASSVSWGDRTRLLSKDMAYVFSVDFAARSQGTRLRVEPAGSSGLRHVFGHSVVTTADGTPADVPTGRINWGDLEIGDSLGISPAWANLRLTIDLTAGAVLSLESSGVVNFNGGSGAFFSNQGKRLTGSLFVSSQQHSTVTAYRWLQRRQLFGVGQLDGKREDEAEPWNIAFKLDFYSVA